MIFVTGGTGKVGREGVRQLARKKPRQESWCARSRRLKRSRSWVRNQCKGNLTNSVGIAPALRGVETVFLLTAPSRNLEEVKGGIVDAAKRAVVRRLVLLSGAGASHNSTISLDRYHLFYATRAELLRALGRMPEAKQADLRAIALTANPAERALLRERIADEGRRSDD